MIWRVPRADVGHAGRAPGGLALLGDFTFDRRDRIFLFSVLFRLCLLRRLGRLGRLRFGFLLSLIFTGISDFLESFSRAIGLTGFRETPQEILERGLCVIGPVEIFFLNSADGEERLAAISAAGILLQEKIVRIDRGL